MRTVRTVSIVLLLGAVAGCTSRETPETVYAAPAYAAPPAGSNSLPPERSYLDPGPAVSRGGPSYLYDNVTSAPRQTDSFGNDVLGRRP